MHKNRFSIYRLYDRRKSDTRYVGLTRNALALRLEQHKMCDGSNPEKDTWIKESGPENIEIEEIDVAWGIDEARRKEASWIHSSLDKQEMLTNIIIPGRDGKGYTKVKSLRTTICPPVRSSTFNTARNALYIVGIPKHSNLFQLLQADAQKNNLSIAKLIVVRLADYYRLRDNGIALKAKSRYS